MKEKRELNIKQNSIGLFLLNFLHFALQLILFGL